MRIEWLSKKGEDQIILFFNGWGMDEQVVSHLKTEADVLMFYDYRDIEELAFPDLNHYREIIVIAWSMGVWAAANVLPKMNICPAKLIGINGTEHPVDDLYGIPVRIYQLTEKGMNEEGQKKFIRRMLKDEEEWQVFQTQYPQRKLPEVCEELMMIHKQSTGSQNQLSWSKVYISEKDVIFPVANQQKWWQGNCQEIQMLSGGHYPFFQFKQWEEII